MMQYIYEIVINRPDALILKLSSKHLGNLIQINVTMTLVC